MTEIDKLHLSYCIRLTQYEPNTRFITSEKGLHIDIALDKPDKDLQVTIRKKKERTSYYEARNVFDEVKKLGYEPIKDKCSAEEREEGWAKIWIGVYRRINNGKVQSESEHQA